MPYKESIFRGGYYTNYSKATPINFILGILIIFTILLLYLIFISKL